MYTLIGSPKTRAIRVLWCLEELGVNYDLQPSPPRSDEMKAANPSGKAPALMVDGDCITDSAAICTFLADKHGQLTHDPGTIERARQDSAMYFALDEMDSILWMAAKHSFFLPEELRAKGIVEACQWEFGNSMKLLGGRLGDQQHISGGMFTVADIIVVHCANWAEGMFKWELPGGKFADYRERVRSRPAFKRAMEIRNSS